jgi:hypothetical protein
MVGPAPGVRRPNERAMTHGAGSRGRGGNSAPRVFLSLGFILTLGFLLLISLTISTGISTLQKRLGDEHTRS